MKIKKLSILLIISLVFTCLALCSCGGGAADDDDEDEESPEGLLMAQTADGDYMVAGLGTYPDKDVIIPSKYKGRPVVAIYDSAFYNEKITSVVIPGSVKRIRESAFQECEELTSVTFNEGLTKIESYAFDACSSLTELTFPKSLELVDYTAFSDCYELKKLTFLGNTSIGRSAFSHCEKITEIVFSGTDGRAYNIEEQAFSDVKISAIALPEGLEEIGCGAFFGVDTLKTVYLPKSLKSVFEDSFAVTPLEMIYYAGDVNDWANITTEENQYNIYENPLENTPIEFNHKY